MSMSVTERAIGWFQAEWGFRQGDAVRLYVRYGGNNGFSFGIRREQPWDIGDSVTKSGIIFFMSSDDLWHLEGKDIVIDYDAQDDDIIYDLI